MGALGQGRRWLPYFWEAGNILWELSGVGQFCNSGFWSHTAQVKTEAGVCFSCLGQDKGRSSLGAIVSGMSDSGRGNLAGDVRQAIPHSLRNCCKMGRSLFNSY